MMWHMAPICGSFGDPKRIISEVFDPTKSTDGKIYMGACPSMAVLRACILWFRL